MNLVNNPLLPVALLLFGAVFVVVLINRNLIFKGKLPK